MAEAPAGPLGLLSESGLVEREFYSDHPPRAHYQLTESGRALGPVVGALYDFGRRHLTE